MIQNSKNSKNLEEEEEGKKIKEEKLKNEQLSYFIKEGAFRYIYKPDNNLLSRFLTSKVRGDYCAIWSTNFYPWHSDRILTDIDIKNELGIKNLEDFYIIQLYDKDATYVLFAFNRNIKLDDKMVETFNRVIFHLGNVRTKNAEFGTVLKHLYNNKKTPINNTVANASANANADANADYPIMQELKDQEPMKFKIMHYLYSHEYRRYVYRPDDRLVLRIANDTKCRFWVIRGLPELYREITVAEMLKANFRNLKDPKDLYIVQLIDKYNSCVLIAFTDDNIKHLNTIAEDFDIYVAINNDSFTRKNAIKGSPITNSDSSEIKLPPLQNKMTLGYGKLPPQKNNYLTPIPTMALGNNKLPLPKKNSLPHIPMALGNGKIPSQKNNSLPLKPNMALGNNKLPLPKKNYLPPIPTMALGNNKPPLPKKNSLPPTSMALVNNKFPLPKKNSLPPIPMGLAGSQLPSQKTNSLPPIPMGLAGGKKNSGSSKHKLNKKKKRQQLRQHENKQLTKHKVIK